MSKEQDKKTIEKLIKEINEAAKKVVEDYVKNPSEASGSVTQVHEDSPLLKYILKNEKSLGKKKKD